MKLKQLQINKNPEIDPNDKIDKLENMVEKLLNDIKDIKSSLNISDITLGKKFSIIDEKMKNIYENLNSIKSLHKKEMENINIGSNTNQIGSNTNQTTNNFEQKNEKEISQIKIPTQLAKFLNIENNMEFNKKEILQMVWEEFIKRGLIYEKNKRVLRVDDEASQLFNISKSVNDSTDHRDKNCLNFSLLQKSILNIL